MKKLSLFASVSAALVCAAFRLFNWSLGNVTPFSLDTAEARIGRPLRQRALLALAGESSDANTAARGRCCGWSCRHCRRRCRGRLSLDRPRAASPRPALGRRSALRRSGLWLWPGALPGHGDREPCHGKMVQDRI